ncbi:unnamed protein product [Acanthoscelides obtectus]|uniref:Uncharacterized protein n=1 Tax=Acanthoscelides obtectus TaxID=200917 RepID=A0A9P0KTL0_ACAOB|nr:unnamed protein product [Acanthoscelides obtectus]CAK1622098.1 hypothetical protein AOBTE_LOCUS1310 [Acanthoscelides obtectus]
MSECLLHSLYIRFNLCWNNEVEYIHINRSLQQKLQHAFTGSAKRPAFCRDAVRERRPAEIVERR